MSVNTTDDWAWMVCLGTFIIMVLETGMVKALGVLLPVFQLQFETKTWIIGLMISIVPGIGAVTCPLAGVLSKRFSARWTVAIFCTISSAGLIVGYLVSSVYMLSISFLFSGFGFSAEAIMTGELARYFDDKDFSKASAIGRSGVAIGLIVMPLLTQFLNDTYGWRGTMLMLGGINLHCVISGVLLRPMSNHKQGASKRHQHSSSKSDNVNGSKQQGTALYRFIWNKTFHSLDLELFSNFVFITRMVYYFGTGYLFNGWLIYLVPSAVHIGISPYRAVFLATLGGVGNLCGYVVFPIMHNVIPNTALLYSASVSNCFFLLLHPISCTLRSYVGLGISSAGLGVGRTLGILANTQIAKENIRGRTVTNAFMWFFVAYSLGSILSGFLSGWIFDQTGNYTISFIVLGASAILSVSPQLFADYMYNHPEKDDYSPIPSGK